MRNDAIGLFWGDVPHVIRKDKKKAVQKVVPPDPVWLSPDYLPNLKEAQEFKVPLMTDEDLVNACINKERLLFDIETYQNYFLASRLSILK